MASPWSQVRVGFSISAVEPLYWDWVTDENLAPLSKTGEDVVDVQHRQYYPGHPYLENRLAKTNHPLVGNGSAHLCFSDGSRATICDIYYQDWRRIDGHERHVCGQVRA